ncbi:hypothetical protein [Nostoc sp.]|uniref:hypothetical protein n=1 Tax=Nostoc sp. TaxID=1180 RepID=UPI003593D10B
MSDNNCLAVYQGGNVIEAKGKERLANVQYIDYMPDQYGATITAKAIAFYSSKEKRAVGEEPHFSRQATPEAQRTRRNDSLRDLLRKSYQITVTNHSPLPLCQITKD